METTVKIVLGGIIGGSIGYFSDFTGVACFTVGMIWGMTIILWDTN